MHRRFSVRARRGAVQALLAGLFALDLAVAGAQASARAEATPAEAVSEGARQTLARVQPSVIQIKGFFGSNTAQAFHGTGFAAAEGGRFVTNYHVVAQKVQYPDKYRLEYRTPEGRTGAIVVLAVDARHDLAVVRAEGHAPPPLRLEPAVPSKGSRAYSVGYPLDVGLTITEGVSNGRVEDSFDPRIHYSGAINAGMSGGPALDAQGAVIGVNVSGYLFRQLVSFLVPAAHAQSLLGRAVDAEPDPAELRAVVQAQIAAHASDLLAALGGTMVTQQTAGYVLPEKISPFIDCGASSDPAPDSPVRQVTINCSAKAGIYVEQGQSTGDVTYSHYVLTSTSLDAWRFAQRLGALAGASGGYGERRHVGPFACEDRVVRLRGFDAAALVCARSHRKLPGLYDITARVSSVSEARRGFASHLDMYGVGFEDGMAFVQRYMEAMEYRP